MKCVITLHSLDKTGAVNEHQGQPVTVQLPGLSF